MRTCLNGRKVSQEALSLNMIFIGRAVSVCAALVFGTDTALPFQVVTILAATTILLCFVLHNRSHLWTESLVLYQHVFNELTIVAACLIQFWWSEYVEDYAKKQDIGKAFIGLILGNIIVNLIFMLV